MSHHYLRNSLTTPPSTTKPAKTLTFAEILERTKWFETVPTVPKKGRLVQGIQHLRAYRCRLFLMSLHRSIFLINSAADPWKCSFLRRASPARSQRPVFRSHRL